MNLLGKTEYRNGRFVDIALKTDSKSVYFAVTEDKHIKQIEN